MRETLKHIYAIAETFFEWPTEDRTHVTYASACFLAEHVLEQERKEATEALKIADAALKTMGAAFERIIEISGLTDVATVGDLAEYVKHQADMRDVTRATLAAVEAENTILHQAITKTLAENGHLADGDNCTLIDLKQAIGMP